MHAHDAPARRRRGEPIPSTNLRGARLAGRCAAERGTLAQLLTEELLTVRATFLVEPGVEASRDVAHRLLHAVLPRRVPADAVEDLATDLAAGDVLTLTDVDVRLWFLAWSLEDDGHHAASRST